jgi:hypothetical protein
LTEEVILRGDKAHEKLRRSRLLRFPHTAKSNLEILN